MIVHPARERRGYHGSACVGSRGARHKVSQGSLHDSNGIVIEDGRNVFRWEFVRGVGDQEAGLSDSTITDDDTPEQGLALSRFQLAIVPVELT